MRLSPARVALRAVLLTVGGGYMLYRAWDFHGGARALGEHGALLEAMAWVAGLVGALALAAAWLAVRSLRRRPRGRTHSLRLDDLPPPRRGRD